MIRRSPFYLALTILAGLAWLLTAEPALACSVCFGGDPNSSMNQGVRAGMLILMGVIGGVLAALASLFIFWMRRAARLEAQSDDAKKASRAIPSAAQATFPPA